VTEPQFSPLHFEQFEDADSSPVVTAYHGTLVEHAHKIVDEQRVLPSTNSYDWLGHGAYFWEGSPLRALQWAEHDRDDPAHEVAVVKARINLGACLDLIDSRYETLPIEAERRFKVTEGAAGRELPTNKGKLRRLDCAVFNYLCQNVDLPIDTIRALYSEGVPAYDSANLYTRSHIHLCVRNPVCVLTLSIFDGPFKL
jgi:hypothetical protein